jgi:hypothetical protein
MKWSWKLTRLAGIDVYVHATFFVCSGLISLEIINLCAQRARG